MNETKHPLVLPLVGVLVLAALSGVPAIADGAETIILPVKPWNGYWWPTWDGGMITGVATRDREPYLIIYPDWEGFFAPFDKYSLAFGDDPRGELWSWENQYHYIPDAPSWYGHCNGWAAASIFEPEPAAGEMNGIYFRVGDKKAILTELHQSDIGITYGYDPAHPENSITPVFFHTTLIQHLRYLGKPVIIERDPSEQVWNYPCYGYEMSWVDVGNYRNFTTILYFSKDFVPPDTTDTEYLLQTVTYRFTLDGDDVVASDWTGDSVVSHPHFMWDVAGRASANPYLDPGRIDPLMATTVTEPVGDDLLEDNDTRVTAAPLNQAVYFGRLLDPDFFRFETEAGETLDVAFHPQKLDVTAASALTDAQGNPVGTMETVDTHKVYHAGKQVQDASLYLGITSATPQASHRNYGIELVRTGRSFYMPHVVNADGWGTEMFLFNPGADPEDLFFHFYRTVGGGVEKPQYQSTLPTLEAGAVRFGSLDSFFLDLTPENERWLKIRADNGLEGMFLFANDSFGGNLASMPLLDQGAYTLYFNHLAVDDTWWTGVSIANTDPYQTARVTLQPYTPAGAAVGSALEMDIPGGGRYINMLAQAFPPETLTTAGWIQVISDVPVVGFELFGTNDLSLFEGIPLQSESQTTLIAPWVPSETGWWTGISIVNTSGISLTVEISPLNANGGNAYGTLNPRTETQVLPAGAKWVTLVSELFNNPAPTNGPIAYLKIVTMSPVKPVTGFVLYGNFDQQILCGYPLMGALQQRSAGVLLWKEGATLVVNNALGNNRATVSLSACDAAGTTLATVQAPSVGVKTVGRWDIAGLFGGTVPTGTVFLRWSTGGKNVLVLQEVLQPGRGTTLNSIDLQN